MTHRYISHERSRNKHEPFHRANTASRLAFLDKYDSKGYFQPHIPTARLHGDHECDSIVSESEERSNGVVFLAIGLILLVSLVLFLLVPFIFALLVATPLLLGFLSSRCNGKSREEDMCPFGVGAEDEEALERKTSIIPAPLAHGYTAHLPSTPSPLREETSSEFFDLVPPPSELHPPRYHPPRTSGGLHNRARLPPSWRVWVENFFFLPVILSLILGVVECVYEGVFGRWWNPLTAVINLVRFRWVHYVADLIIWMVGLLWVVLRVFVRVAWKGALTGVTIPGELEGYEWGLGRGVGAEQYQFTG